MSRIWIAWALLSWRNWRVSAWTNSEWTTGPGCHLLSWKSIFVGSFTDTVQDQALLQWGCWWWLNAGREPICLPEISNSTTSPPRCFSYWYDLASVWTEECIGIWSSSNCDATISSQRRWNRYSTSMSTGRNHNGLVLVFHNKFGRRGRGIRT